MKIVYQYEDGTQAAQPVMRSLIAGDSYEITSPIIEGYTADKPVVSGTMPEEDLTVTVTYTADPPSEPQTYTLTVNYRYENGSQVAQPVTRSLTAGSSYEITSPIIEGYTADKPVVSGTMPAEDLTVTVTYTANPPPEPQTYTLTVNYRYENGSQAAQPVTRSLTAGSSYEITSPAIEGYTADKPVVSGTMPAEDLTVTVTYTAVPPPEPQTYTLTVNYRYENGSQAAQPITRSLTAGSSYEITSPTIKNYTADRVVVSGIMPERDLTVHVLYRKDSSGSSKPSGWFDAAPDVEWKDPFEWFDAAPSVEWKDPFAWFDAAPNVEWKDPFIWFDAAPDVEWWSPFPWGE
ncbi:MucBP domain-containing protein [Anaerotruncus sp. 1XD42-93]|uniref:MucBP domain-containing protein n=1 Tax=Anaerotruncus sp. 1XD42-93 TaxID=2320853 RepID=UPI0013146A16|nr:MucBP domain-containing protein [Anaerotruncus sp. 1XD42-93]